MLPSDDCDSCTPSYMQHRVHVLDSLPLLSYIPFLLSFLIVSALVTQKIVPTLATYTEHTKQEHGDSQPPDDSWSRRIGNVRITAKRVAAAACGITIALSTVLVELILCEISNTVDPVARGLALRATLIFLLLLLVLIIPALEISSTIGTWRRQRTSGKLDTWHVALTSVTVAGWLGCFWYLPYVSILPDTLHGRSTPEASGKTSLFLQGCLKRIGIIGIALMAALAGFAAVSSVWQTLGVKRRLVRETDVARKDTGLASVHSMLETKRSRLRALDSRAAESSPSSKGFLARVAGSIKGSNNNERQGLELEIAGLETMEGTLQTTLANLHSSYDAQKRSKTTIGKLINAGSVAFAVYCLVRIATMSWSAVRRIVQPGWSASTMDPVSHVLALLTTHYDQSLDYQAWSRQISFAMSGVILLLSFSAVLQTFRVFSRVLPAFLQKASNNLPLVVSQIAGTYVISSALLLRSSLPPEVSSVIGEALGTPLDARFSEVWFEGWFLAAAGLTVGGIMISRKMSVSDWDDWDDSGDLEMGKMN